MKKNVVANPTPRSNKRRKSPSASSEVTVNQVINNLFDLFDRAGIDVQHPISNISETNTNKTTECHLHPYTSAIGELLTSWYQDPAYLDNLGNPSPIKYRGPRQSFFNLAKRAVPNVNASLLLTELERLGAVSIDSSKFIRVHMRSLPVYEDKQLAIQHTLTSLDGFIKTLHHNLGSVPSNSDQLFHRVAWAGDFDGREIAALKIRMKRHGQNFLESCDNWLALKSLPKSRLKSQVKKRMQVSVGVYLSVGST
jgi:hypothetical protein